jgi:hypothetical protein
MAATVSIRSTNRLPRAIRAPADRAPDHRVPLGALRGVVGRWHTRHSREGPQALLDPQDLRAGPPRPRALAAHPVLQRRLDLAPQAGHRRTESSPIHFLGLEAMPLSEQPIRPSQQLLPDRSGGAAAVDHRLENRGGDGSSRSGGRPRRSSRRSCSGRSPRSNRPGSPAPPGRPWRCGCGRLALQADRVGVGRTRLGRVDGVELEPGLEIAHDGFQLSNPIFHRLPGSQEGGLGVGGYGVPEGFRDRKSAAHIQ